MANSAPYTTKACPKRWEAPVGTIRQGFRSAWPASSAGVPSSSPRATGGRKRGSTRRRRRMAAEEILDIVDDDDRVLSKAPRHKVLGEYHIHRAVVFFVFDREGDVFVNQRSQLKEIYPGYWSVAFGGHVLSGESYDAAALREVQEETGLFDRPVQIGVYKKRTADERENVRIYRVV